MDSILGIGGNELIVIALLAAIILGPERIARSARDRQVRPQCEILFLIPFQRTEGGIGCARRYGKNKEGSVEMTFVITPKSDVENYPD